MKKLAVLSITLLISACGGGGDGIDSSNGVTYSGSQSPSSINDTNAKEIGEAAGESIEKAANSSSIPSSIAIQNSLDINEINTLILSTLDQSSLPTGVDVSSRVCSSGSASSNLPSATSGPGTFVVNYNNCRLRNSTMTFTGKAVIRFTDFNNFNEPYSISYINLKVKRFGYQEVTLNLVLDCSSRNNCTYNSDFTGSDGNTHRVSQISFSGNSVYGYNGSANFYHARYGRSSITVSNITYGNCGVNPDGGSIIYTSINGSSGTISFSSDCTASGTWTNGSTSGIF